MIIIMRRKNSHTQQNKNRDQNKSKWKALPSKLSCRGQSMICIAYAFNYNGKNAVCSSWYEWYEIVKICMQDIERYTFYIITTRIIHKPMSNGAWVGIFSRFHTHDVILICTTFSCSNITVVRKRLFGIIRFEIMNKQCCFLEYFRGIKLRKFCLNEQ